MTLPWRLPYVAAAAIVLVIGPLAAQQQSRSRVEESSAVDAKGVRHRMSEYGEGAAPWVADRVKVVKPDYPSADRAQHIEGTGVFRVTLDVNTGGVASVTVTKSTGASGLDDSAMRAIRLWRWRPHTWKEIDVPVFFTLGARQPYGGSVHDLQARAGSYYRKGDNDKAIRILNEALRLQPTSASAYVDRGCA
jgi:TonB family protein